MLTMALPPLEGKCQGLSGKCEQLTGKGKKLKTTYHGGFYETGMTVYILLPPTLPLSR